MGFENKPRSILNNSQESDENYTLDFINEICFPTKIVWSVKSCKSLSNDANAYHILMDIRPYPLRLWDQWIGPWHKNNY